MFSTEISIKPAPDRVPVLDIAEKRGALEELIRVGVVGAGLFGTKLTDRIECAPLDDGYSPPTSPSPVSTLRNSERGGSPNSS